MSGDDSQDSGDPEETPEERRIRLCAEYDAWWMHHRECVRRNRLEAGKSPDDPPVPVDPPDTGPSREPPVGWKRANRKSRNPGGSS